MEKRESSVEDIVLPVELVELTGKGLRTKDGKPIVVRVEFVDEEIIVEAAEAMPGTAPEIGLAQKPDKVKTAKQMVKLSPALIEASCVLMHADGREVRPAFYFGEDPGTGALPGRFLSFGDKLKLVLTLLRLCGFVGGAADRVTFPDEGREAGAGGAPPVDVGGSGGAEAVRAGDGAEASEPATAA